MAAPRTRTWREPTSLLPLTWGTYTDRYLVGLVLIVGGAVHLLGANTWSLPLLVVGTAAELVGWLIMPSAGWRRMVATLPAVVASWVLLTGPLSVWVLVLSYLSWLLVRQRPLRSYLTALLPLASGVLIPQFLRDYSGMLVAVSICAVVLVGSAWLARLIAVSARASSTSSATVR